jgi:hypothetical protein
VNADFLTASRAKEFFYTTVARYYTPSTCTKFKDGVDGT